MKAVAPILLAALVLWAGCKSNEPAEPPLEDLGTVPAFELTDQAGSKLTGNDLQGRVYVANTFFTSCRTVCPALMKQVHTLAERLKDAPVTFVSITVDPDNDTPEVLASYAAEMDADPARWKFLTGDWEAIKALVTDGFHTAMGRPEKTGEVMDITHSGKLFLVDPSGHIRGYFDTDEASLKRLENAARGLAAR